MDFSGIVSSDKLTVLISPTHRCNMRCDYCYVSDTSYGDMSIFDFKAAYTWLIKYCNFLDIKFIDFTWFGGEPLLYGEANLENALNEQRRCFEGSDIKFINRLQSNLTLVNEKICFLIKEYFDGFIGGSFEPYGLARKYVNGRNAAIDIERAIDYLHTKDIRVGIVSTLIKNDLQPPQKLYDWYSKHVDMFRVNRAHSPDGKRLEQYLTVDEYNDYVIALFDLYTREREVSFKFTNFAAIARSILLKRPFCCTDVNEPYWKLSICGNGAILSYCRKFDMSIGNYYFSAPQDIIEAYKRKHDQIVLNVCRECDSYINNICSGSCWGEPNKNCHESCCGYRSEYTLETISYVQQYLQLNEIESFEDCYSKKISKIL